MNTPKHIGDNLLINIALLATLFISLSAHAHIALLDPPARTTDTNLTIAPCGGIDAGASVATFTSGSEVEITFNLSQQHSQNTRVYISFDDFETRTLLAQMPTPISDVYKMTVPLPLQSTGAGTLQIKHQNYYSCADITLESNTEFILNAALNDAWYNPDTSGQGFFVTVFPDLGFLSLAWFTYDTELPNEDDNANLGSAGHRWLTALGDINGNKSVMDINIASGGIFDSPSDVVDMTDGTITLTFDDCNSGTVEYNIPSIDMQGTIPIQRVAADNSALCEVLSSD